MGTENVEPKGKRRLSKKLLWLIGAVLFIVSAISFYLYSNFNKLLSEALLKSFNSGIISDVYELKFEKLNVNVLTGGIQVNNVELKPREKPLFNYPYINSSLTLHAKKILLTNVEIITLLKTNILRLKSIEFLEPEIEVKLSGKKFFLFPFRDTSEKANTPSTGKKNFIEALLLNEFGLVNASLHIVNDAQQRELIIKNLSISLKDLMMKQEPGKDIISNRLVELSIGEINWRWKKGAIQHINVSEYRLKMDSLSLQNSPDTLLYRFTNFSTGLKVFNMQTADSLFHLSMESFNLSYRDKAITLTGIKFDPNISDAAMQRRFTYQTPVFSGSVGTVSLIGLNFDSLIYVNKIFIDEVVLDSLSVTIFKDQSKPLNKNKFPKYPGQQIGSINMPLLIKHLKARNVNLVNSEKKPDGQVGKININRMTIDAINLTSLPSSQMLSVQADAWIENKAHATLVLQFNYASPQFSISGKVQKFNLPEINHFLQSYTPASIKKGVADEVSLFANAYSTYATGNMKFLYHDLEADLNLKDQEKWKSDLLTFVGNTFTQSSNPPSADKPARIVQFRVDRDMNKGFINIIVKSVIAGFKETMFMSKENRKNYKEAKKRARRDSKSKE